LPLCGSEKEEILYYKNGYLKRKVVTVTLSQNECLTLCTFYHETGFISSQGFNDLNGKTRLWEYFDADGVKIMEEIYEDGKLISNKNYLSMDKYEE